MTDNSVKWLGGLISGEIVVAVFVAAIAWGAMSQKSESMEKEVENLRSWQISLSQDVREEIAQLHDELEDIRVTMERIQTNQKNYTEFIKHEEENTRRIIEMLEER